MKCNRCPIKTGDCIAATDPRRAHLCDVAARGTASDLAAIRAMSARGVAPTTTTTTTPVPPSYPSLATQAANLAGAAVRFITSGLATVDQAEYDRRRAICEGCKPYYDPATNRCRKCGCALAIKPWSKAERCPAEKW